MPHGIEVRVIHRNLRWEVSVRGVTRPLIDWLCTKERAIDHAIERARELEATILVVEDRAGSIEEIVHLDDPKRLKQASVAA